MLFKPFRFITSIGMQPPLAFLLLLLCSFFTSLAYAEGSRELIVSAGGQGYRPFLEFSDFTRNGEKFQRKSIIKVFVNKDEWVYLGSGVFNAVPNSTQDIVYRSPAGTQNGSCDVKDVTDATEPGQGFINTLAKEAAGPKTPDNPNGYIPCKFQAAETGVYEIEFHPPKVYEKKTANYVNKEIKVTVQFLTDITQGITVSAWDVTVLKTLDVMTTEQKGRAYANFLSMSVHGDKKDLYSKFFILTNQGFLYQISSNGSYPNIFTFFANNKGFRDAAGKSLFKSVPLAGINYHSPAVSDNDSTNDVTHKIFFNPPDLDDLPTTTKSPSGDTWLLSDQPTAPAINSFAFVGAEGTSNKAGTNPLGGEFRFNTNTPSATYILTIDANQNGIYGDANDPSLFGITVNGDNSILWDGLGSDKVALPPSAGRYDAKLTLSIDDVHFPFLDVENNPKGLIVQRVTRENPTNVESSIVYYDNTGLSGTPPTPISALQGFDSSSGAQIFSGFGDAKGIDTWTSVANTAQLDDGITLRKADLTVSKSHSPANPTTTTTAISYTITVANNGPSDASGIRVQDTIPAAVQTPTWTCAAVSPNLCALTSGSGNIDTTVDLKTGASATFTINGTLSGLAEGTVVTNDVTITRPNDVTNPVAATADKKTETATDTFTVGLAGNNPPTITNPPTATTPNDKSVKLPALSATDSDSGDTIQSYTITTLPPVSQGVLYLGDPANGGTPITAGQVLTPGQESNLWFSPTHGFTGPASFEYVATDNHGASTSPAAKVTVTVTAGNQPPVAKDTTTDLILNTQTAMLLKVPATPTPTPPLDATDPDGSIASYTIATIPVNTEGVLYLGNGGPAITPGQPLTNADRSNLYFQPVADFTGAATFTYTATDNGTPGLVSNTATVTIPVHLPPVAADNTISPPVPNTSTGQLLPTSPLPAGDDGTVVSYKIDSLPDPSQGTLYLNSPTAGNEVRPNQVLSPAEADKLYFKPNPTFTGDAKFTFSATDDQNAVSNVATVTIPVIAPPVATDDSGATTKGTPTTINLLTDDTNPNAATGSPPTITQPTNGTVNLNPDGTVTYTPNSNFTGTDTFTYQICDKYNNCDTATVTVTVSDITIPPTANDDTANTVSNTPEEIPIFANDQNPNPGNLSITDPPDHGIVVMSNPVDGTVTYTPTSGFTGTDTFTYQTCDTSGTKCDTATVTVNVSNPASPPQVTKDEATTSPGQPVTISVLSNDPNATGVLSIKTQGSHGKAVVNSGGTITYTPNPGFTGIDTFTYELCNDAGVCTTAEVKVTVAGTTPPPTDPATPPPTDPTTPPPTNPPGTPPPAVTNPVTVDNDSAATTMGQPITIPVLANDHHADPSNVFVATPPAHGRVNVNADGTVTYIPAEDFSGVDTFTYQACDAQNNCATATVTVNVADLASPPITKDDPAATTSGDPVIIPILANDENPNPDNVTIIDPPDHGTVVVNPDLTATYTPEPGFTGTDSFTYQTCNLKDQCDTATATINVTAPSSPTKPTLSVTFGGNGSGNVQSTPAGINCDTNTAGCTQIYDLATSVTLTPTPTADSEFVGWGGDGDCNDSNLSMTDDRHCIAYFNLASQPKFPLTVETTGEGSVTSQPVGVDCGADCGNDFPSNVLVNLTAIPEPGFIFTGWSGDCSGTSSTVSVTMTQARTCVAHFEELPTLSNDVHHLTVTKIGTGNGTVISVLPGIDCGATCNNAYPHNSQITLTATPDPGTQFVGWSGSCSGTEPTITVMLDQAKSCIAIFDSVTPVLPPESGYEEVLTVQNQSPFKATIRSDVAGIEILPSSSQGAKSAAHYPLGTVVKLTVTPEPGVKFVGFDGDEDCQDGTVTITQHLNCFPIFEQLHPGIVQFSSPTSTVDEFGNATTTITVSRKGGCDGKISVDYATFSDTATQPADYSSASGTLTWEDGDCADKIISIPIRNDSVGEDDETIDILLSHPTGGATLGPSKKATLTILDDESRSTTNTSTTTTNPSGCYNFSPCQMCCNSCQAEGEGGDESEIQFKTLILTLYVGQTMTITVADAAGDLLLKELPDQSIASLDNWTPIGKGAGTLTFTGRQVGTTNMLLVDGATPSKMASIHINVIEDNGMTISSEEEQVPGPANSFGVQAILVTLTVGQTVSVTVAGGKGELSIGEIPQPTVASLDAWIPLGATGAGEVTLRGVGVGNTKAVLLDRSDPPQKTIINVKVIPGGDSSTSSQGEGTEGENADGGDANGGDANGGDANSGNANGGNANGGNANGGNANGGNANGGDTDFSADESGPIPEGTNDPLVWKGKPIAGTDSVLDQDACNHNSWGLDAKGDPIESRACFIGRIRNDKGRYHNHQMLSHFDAQTLNLSELIIVDPEHVGQEADILMVGVRTILTDQAKFTRDDQKWSLWDGELSSLLVAQHEDKLPEVLEVPIYDGDLSFAPGEYYVFVGYRLHDGTIVYNGADFIHFYIGNAASMDINNDSPKKVTSYEVETAAYFEPFIHNGKKGADTKKGNDILFDNDETLYVSTFVRIDSKHVGQPADILMVAVYEQGDDYVIYTRDAYWWHEWDRRLESLQPTQHYHQLPLTMEIPIYFGKLSEKPGKFTVYIGYRLRDGVIIFNGFEPLQLTVAEAQTVGPRGMRNTVTPPPSHLIHQRYQTVENPFAGQSSVGFTNTLLVTPDLVGQVRDIVMVVTGQDEITAWEDLDKSQVVWEVTLPQVRLKPVMELPAFEGKGMEEYRVYVGYR